MKNRCNRKFWLLYTADIVQEAELVVWIIFVRRGIFYNTSSTIQLEVLILRSYLDKVNEKHVQPQILTPLYWQLWTQSRTGGLNHLRTTRDFLKHLQHDSIGGFLLCSYPDEVNEKHVQLQILTPFYSKLWKRSRTGGLIISVRHGTFWKTSSTILLEVLLLHS